MTRQPIPERIGAALDDLGPALTAWCTEGQDRALEAHEQAVLDRVRAVLPRLQWAQQACPGCGQQALPHGALRRRQVATQCGTLTLARPYYHCGHCGHGWSVTETTLGVPARARISNGLDRWAARLGATTDFREAAALLAEPTGLALGAETARQHTQALGAAVRAAEDGTVAHVERTREPAGPVEAAAGRLLVETDGAMVRYLDGFHEVKLGLIGGWGEGRLVTPNSVAAREPAAWFGRRLAAEAARRGALAIVRWDGDLVGRGLAVLREVTDLGDGARWIWDTAVEHFGARVEIVDWFHATEHLHTVGRALFGEGEAATVWARARAGELLDGGAAPVLAILAALRAPTPEAEAVLRTERGYFATNADRMAYPGLFIEGDREAPHWYRYG